MAGLSAQRAGAFEEFPESRERRAVSAHPVFFQSFQYFPPARSRKTGNTLTTPFFSKNKSQSQNRQWEVFAPTVL